mmetsp:Transcript_31151/g.69962  ORF Transcript_31151/g.69962 Transcript_31151/m.69962 type:complete len:325 (+) Transcript_31151:217-1191(+)|eukprot:CAMPEP_0172589882 /NCGR_PEP_ID=MMETSP1068-20121228/8429_1 /TAXON_ID=35684 /ORGANISM="Pseudopedinella elastica, Strain CCMP716" /LENGTH=324 /DNA_ID=CAMNT_0013385545 /DNA_START=209 /DNA_END=1183 /DNA_ORIENTATION=+
MRSFFLCLYVFYSLGTAGALKKCRYTDVKEQGDEWLIPSHCSTIAFGGASIGDEGVTKLCAALEKAFSGGGLRDLKEVHLPTCKMGPAGSHALAKFMLKAGGGSPIRVLNLYGNNLGDNGAASIAEIFKNNNEAGIPLELLGLGVNAIGARGAGALAKTLGECPACPLKTLGLYRNDIGDEGAAAIAPMIKNNQIALSSLFLGGNGVKNGGAKALSDALPRNTHLKVLSLEGGTIGDEGAQALAAALAISQSVTMVDVRSCLPTHRGCSAGHLTEEDVANGAEVDPEKMTTVGLNALKGAVAKRASSSSAPSLKIVGDIKFNAE